MGSEEVTAGFTRWNYGGLTQASQEEDEAGYTEFGDQDGGCYSGLGYGFAGAPGKRNSRAPLPSQEDAMPKEVATEVAKNEKVIDQMPGVLVKAEDGSLKKIVTPGVEMPLPDFKPEPTRFDKSTESVLNGRNAAMFINIECKKRGWDMEFEEVDQIGPVHDRTYTYSLTIGAQNSEDVIVTCGIAKGKKEAKRRCAEAMVLKVSDLPPAPPLHLQPQFQMQMRGHMMRFPGGRGRFMRGGRGGFMPPGFRPRLPPPESEETIFKKYDRTPRGDHPSKNHPISKLCEYIRKNGWPVPQWDLINEKIIQQRKNKHGNANIMLYTYKVTLYPGKGQVEPRVYFGSGPTKKDAKFACGSVAWANIQGGIEPSADAKAAAAASTAEAAAAGADVNQQAAAEDNNSPPVLDPKVQDYNPMQMAVTAISDMNKRVRGGGAKVKEDWLDTVSKNLEQETKIKRFMELPADLRPPTQLIKRQVKDEDEEGEDVEVKTEAKDEEAEDGEIKDGKEERRKKRKSRWENNDDSEVKKEKTETEDDSEKPYQSRSASREKSSTKERDERSSSRKGDRSHSREGSSRDRRDRDHKDRSRSKHDDRGRDHFQHDDRSSSSHHRPHHDDRRGGYSHHHHERHHHGYSGHDDRFDRGHSRGHDRPRPPPQYDGRGRPYPQDYPPRYYD